MGDGVGVAVADVSYFSGLTGGVRGVNNVKSANACMRNRFTGHVRQLYWKPYLWHRAGDAGNVSHAKR